MAPEDQKRARVEERRRMLALRLVRQRASATFRTLAPQLCARGVRFRKLMPEQCRQALGPLLSLPAIDDQILRDSPAATRLGWQSATELERCIKQALARCGPDHGRVAVIFHTAEAGLRMQAGDLAACADLWMLPPEHLWIVPAEGAGLLIEISRADGLLCFAQALV